MSHTPITPGHATIYHNGRCATSRQALQLLQKHDYAITIVDYLATPPDRATLQRLIHDSGLSVREVVRSKETLFTELGLNSSDTTDEQLLDAMLQHPILINRPLVVTPKGTRLARPPEVLQEII